MSGNVTSTGLLQELRRGTLTLAVLHMAKEPTYGYSLVVQLQEIGVDVEQNTLYPLMRRLEAQGMLESSWDTEESRPRKYYRTTSHGEAMKVILDEEWRRLHSVIDQLIEKGKKP